MIDGDAFGTLDICGQSVQTWFRLMVQGDECGSGPGLSQAKSKFIRKAT